MKENGARQEEQTTKAILFYAFKNIKASVNENECVCVFSSKLCSSSVNMNSVLSRRKKV